MPSHIKSRESFFCVLSLNAQNIQAKFSNLEAFIALMHSHNIHFPVICIQETWLRDESRRPIISLGVYQTFNLNTSSNTHGGLIACVDENYDVPVIKKIEMSTTWDGLFLKVKREEMGNVVIIENLYKPPRNNNNVANIRAYVGEIEPIIQDISMHNSEIFICGDAEILSWIS